jgi:protein TonB
MSKIDINSAQWCEMVFEGRNTSFGAYELRTQNSKRHLKALIIASVLFLLAITAPILIKEVMKNAKKSDTMVRSIDYIDVTKKKDKTENQVKEVPEQKQQVMRNTIKFTPPVIKKDEEVKEEDEMKSNQDLMQNKTAIGTTTYAEGTDDANAAMPSTDQAITESAPTEEKIFDVVSQQPEFPGGTAALYEFLAKNILYPPSAREAGIQGKVIVGFVVNKDGHLTDIQVLRSLDPSLDEEALRVVKKIPAWSPGKQGSQAVRVRMTLPIVFKINE